MLDQIETKNIPDTVQEFKKKCIAKILKELTSSEKCVGFDAFLARVTVAKKEKKPQSRRNKKNSRSAHIACLAHIFYFDGERAFSR